MNYYGGWEDDEEDDEEDMEDEYTVYDEDGEERDPEDVVMIFSALMEPGANLKDPSLAEPMSFILDGGGEPDMEEDGLPSKEWLVDALAYYIDCCEVQQAELLYHSRFEASLLTQLWHSGVLGRLGTGAGNMN